MKNKTFLLIAGSGTYPERLIEGARKYREGRIVVLAFRGQTSRSVRHAADECATFGVGELRKMLAFVDSLGPCEAVLAGQITPLALFTTRFDDLLLSIMKSLKVKCAHSIFTALLGLLEERGVDILPASVYMDDSIPAPGVLTKRAPDEREMADIKRGIEAATALGTVDIGQTVVVKDGMVLAAEAFEGTNAAIKRGASLGGKGAVVVKLARKGHDMRFDIPVIGEKTISIMKRRKVSALAFHAHRTILLDKEAVIKSANAANIAIISLENDLEKAPLRPIYTV